ncbi:MAG: dynamin family protein [Sulfurimonadaceae bacterium]
MSLASDYFILYHGLHLSKEEHIEIDKSLDAECFFELSSLILSINRKDFEKMSGLKSFHRLCEKLTTRAIDHLDELYHLQYSLIKHFLSHRSQNNLDHLHLSFNYLLDEEIILKEAHEKLVSLFDPCAFKDEEKSETTVHSQERDFHSEKQDLLVAANELKGLFVEQEPLDDIINYLNSQKFSIGITGVMNAGKSTMLNALMGKEVLGVSVVPETANLTLIKYSSKPSAKVVYWDRSQWRRVEQSAKEIKAMAGFVQETQAYFKEELDEYILESSREDEIDIEELSEYTSASASSKRCNLVRHVELGSELHFLHDGIEIVDTPGLDDIVIQREEITKEYVAQCDLMIHLMNVSQSATSKDIEFIVDALLYQNITKILIVITRVDTVSAEDVKEVIQYTKESITSQLHRVNAESKLDFILKNLHFIALSGKMALLHRTGKSQEALDAGYTLEQSGITEVESYLKQTLFSNESEKSALIIRSAKNRLSKAVKSSLDSFRYELTLLSKSENELQVELEIMMVKKSRESKRVEALREQISAYEEEFLHFLDAKALFLDKELNKLQTLIKQRLLDETRYCLEKEKKRPTDSRVKSIIETALKHGLIDIIRDYRYTFIQRSNKIEEALFTQYRDLFDKPKESEELFSNSFDKGFVTSNNEVLVNRLTKLLSRSSIKTLAKVDQEMIAVIKEEFVYLEELIKSRAGTVSRSLLKTFFIRLKSPIQTLSQRLKSDEGVLRKQLISVTEDESSHSDRSLALHKKIKMIEMIAKRCNV